MCQDTVAVEQLRFGDNDTLSAHVATVLRAQWLFLLTDVDSLYTANPNVLRPNSLGSLDAVPHPKHPSPSTLASSDRIRVEGCIPLGLCCPPEAAFGSMQQTDSCGASEWHTPTLQWQCTGSSCTDVLHVPCAPFISLTRTQNQFTRSPMLQNCRQGPCLWHRQPVAAQRRSSLWLSLLPLFLNAHMDSFARHPIR